MTSKMLVKKLTECLFKEPLNCDQVSLAVLKTGYSDGREFNNEM